jgi:hypothetical protein
MKSIHPLTAKKIKALPTPKAPLKGLGFAREDFDCNLKNPLAAKLWTLIPNSHKDEISNRRAGGYFSWSKVISPEAAKASAKVIQAIWEDEKAKAALRNQKAEEKTLRDLQKRRAEWLAAEVVTKDMINSSDKVSEDGQKVWFAAKRLSVCLTLVDAKEALAASPESADPYSVIRMAAFGRKPATNQSALGVMINERMLNQATLTPEQMKEFLSLVQGQSHPFTGRALELKNKSGLTWSQIEKL